MIIPVRCYNCGEVLADKYEYFLREVRKRKISKNIPLDKNNYFSIDNTKKTIEGDLLDELLLFDVCCRIVILTHVDLK